MSAITIAAPNRRILAIALVATVALAYGVGRWTASSTPEEARDRRPAARGADRADRADPDASTPRGAGGWAPGALAVAPAAGPAAAPPTPELVAAVRTEAAARFEQQRQAIAAACWPSGGLRNGRTSARIRINVTFDRDGREIARGVQEDRRASSGEFTHCLRSMGTTRLAVAPPGTNVGVTFPVQFP